jgi:hypothetical protein
LAFDDKGDNDWNSNDTDPDNPQSDTPRRGDVGGTNGKGQARHEFRVLKSLVRTSVKSILFLML